MKRTAVSLLIVVVFLVPFSQSQISDSQPAIPQGILVQPQKALLTEADVDSLISLCQTHNITTIFLMVKQDTGTESGLVYYNSTRIPRASTFDILFSVVGKAHEKNVRVYAWIPLLYDRWASEAGLGIGDNWVCPLQSSSYYSAIANEVKLYKVDGILFDYLRYSDDFAASEEMKAEFGQKYGYNMETVELSLEKERNTKLWNQWIAYRMQVLQNLLEAIKPKTIPVGVTATSGELQNVGDFSRFTKVDFVAAQAESDPDALINILNLSTEAQAYVILPNNYVSQVRRMVAESTYAEMLVFSSDVWDEPAFQRIEKAEIPFIDIRMTRLPFIEFLNEQYDMGKWKSYEVNTLVIPAGHVFFTYFKFQPYKEKWSSYTQKYNRDYVEEMILKARDSGLYVVLQVDIQSEEYIMKHQDAASITYQWGVNPKRICMTEMENEPFKTEFFEMAKYLADHYDAEALLITSISYLEDCFCTDCLKSYIAFMGERGVPVEDWPRVNGQIDIYHQTVRDWKTAHLTLFLNELREYLRDSNKAFWVEVPVSQNLEHASSEYGLYLPEVRKISDRIVLTNVDIKNPPRIEIIVKSLSEPSGYIFFFPVEQELPPTRTYLFDSLTTAYDQGIDSVGVYPQSSMTDNLWGAFYISYAYRLSSTDGILKELYDMRDYSGVIHTYNTMREERAEEEKQNRERARQNISEARRTYLLIPPSLEEARQLNINVAPIEAQIQENLDLLAEAKNLFIQGDYTTSEAKAKSAAIEFSTLSSRLQSSVKGERLKRISSGVLTLVVFLLIMMYVRLTMRRKNY